jgi:ferredoxin-NADP reductase
MTWEADGVLSLVLVDPEGGPLPLWTPGAHVDLDLAPGLRRSYSLCGDPADERRWQVAVLRETAVLEGDVDHRDSLLTPAEQAAGDTMFICVSRSRSQQLVIDL